LSLYRCPACEALSIICEEAGCIFPEPTNLAIGTFAGYFSDGAKCPHCRRIALQDLVPATLEQIQAISLQLGELRRYEQ
jgi:hypothetical protein